MMIGKMTDPDQGSANNGNGSTKIMNTIFALSRPLATLLRECYVGLDEGINRIIYQGGNIFKK